MTINITWVNSDQTVIKLEFPPVWTWNDLYDAKHRVEAMLDQADHDCAVLYILPSNAKIPENLLSNALRLLREGHARAKLSVVVTPSFFMRTMAELVRKISADVRNLSRVVETIEQAHEALIEAGFLTAQDRIET